MTEEQRKACLNPSRNCIEKEKIAEGGCVAVAVAEGVPSFTLPSPPPSSSIFPSVPRLHSSHRGLFSAPPTPQLCLSPSHPPPGHPVLLLARLSSKRSRWHATAPSSKHLRQSLAVLKTVRGPQASSISIPWALDYSKASRAPPRLMDRTGLCTLMRSPVLQCSGPWQLRLPPPAPARRTLRSSLPRNLIRRSGVHVCVP